MRLAAPGKSCLANHIQKLVYLACSWSIVPERPYEFVIHQFGPYSYGLDRNISEMEAFGK